MTLKLDEFPEFDNSPKQNQSVSSYFEFHYLIQHCECTFPLYYDGNALYFHLYFFYRYLQLLSRGNPAKEYHKHHVCSLSLHMNYNNHQSFLNTRCLGKVKQRAHLYFIICCSLPSSDFLLVLVVHTKNTRGFSQILINQLC